MPFDWANSVTAVLAAAWAFYIALLAVWVLLQKRAPEATIGWILTLAFLPYIGFLVFYFLGPMRLQKQRRRRLSDHLAHHVSADLQALKNRTRNLPVSLRQMAHLGMATTGILPCTAQSVTLLRSGAETFDAILAAVAAAEHHIHLEYYIFEPDQTGTRLRDALIEKARQGVEVRLLVDALGSQRLRNAFVQPLLEAGGQFARFHDTRLGRRWRPVINYRTHRKLVICDGVVGFTGGVNITDEEDLRLTADGYQDVHVRLEGNPAFWMQFVFLQDWAYANDMTIAQCLPELPRYLLVCETGPHEVQLFTSGPDNPIEPIHRAYIEAINHAERRVLLTTPYFVPSEPAMMALTNAALRGVDVHVLVPQQSDSRLVTLAARSYFEELSEAGVTVWEYKAGMLHSKTLVIDDSFGFIGTANFDQRSFRLNFEVGVAIYGAAFNAELAQQFDVDLQQARKVPRRRALRFRSKLAEATARLFSPML